MDDAAGEQRVDEVDPRVGWKIVKLGGPGQPPWALRFTDYDEQDRIRHRFIAEGLAGASYDSEWHMQGLFEYIAEVEQERDALLARLQAVEAEWGLYHGHEKCVAKSEANQALATAQNIMREEVQRLTAELETLEHNHQVVHQKIVADAEAVMRENTRLTAALAQAECTLAAQDETHRRCEKEMDGRVAQAERERDDERAWRQQESRLGDATRAEVARLREGVSAKTLAHQVQLDAIHEAARVDQPDEDKHALAVRIMALARPASAPLTMGTADGFKGSD